MMPGIAYKVYVPVLVEHTEDGEMLPRMVTWTDGQKFEIDRVSAIRPSFAAKAGGQGDRYTIRDFSAQHGENAFLACHG